MYICISLSCLAGPGYKQLFVEGKSPLLCCCVIHNVTYLLGAILAQATSLRPSLSPHILQKPTHPLPYLFTSCE